MNKIYQKSTPEVKNPAKCRLASLCVAAGRSGLIALSCFYSCFSRRVKNVRGFTLLELLVVVLIVGILAAAALPLYQAVVMKSKLAKYIPLAVSLKQAEERYYMANGEYTDNTSLLDIRVPDMSGSGYVIFDDGWWIDVLEWGENTPWIVIGSNSPRGNVTQDVSYRIYLDNIAASSAEFVYRGQHRCIGGTDLGRRVCKSVE